ncbi:hypothetical protein GBAR_LOCUS15414 [Geodia barretti]|uniref:Uncharacterized protein n=1 Tax=Geodia barretti TaxID=519541 RepID=A0AA35SE07_GEOBA|nr:hypothetical protein GBAR_LOCUS15414 [Geodia barretti]
MRDELWSNRPSTVRTAVASIVETGIGGRYKNGPACCSRPEGVLPCPTSVHSNSPADTPTNRELPSSYTCYCRGPTCGCPTAGCVWTSSSCHHLPRGPPSNNQHLLQERRHDICPGCRSLFLPWSHSCCCPVLH